MKRTLLTLLAAAFLAMPLSAETLVTAGAGGIFPAGTTFGGVPINGLESGIGIEIADTGSSLGQFTAVLVGVSLLGTEQRIKIVGKAATGSRVATNVATFSGTCSVDMGDGTLPSIGVPFTATITTNTSDQGGIGLVIGTSSLPEAVVNAGTMTIK